MKFRSIFFAALAIAILAGSSPAHQKKGKPVKKADRHWMLYKVKKGERSHWVKGDFYDITVAALRGQSATDVYISVETDDPVKHPIPEEFEKLQIKFLNQDGEVTYVKHLRNVPITDGEAVVSLANLYPLTKIEVQGHLEARHKRTDIVRGAATVLFRPDLAVLQVQAPAAVAPNAMFNITALIEEKKLQTGASADVSLYEGETLLATVADVVVVAGGQVSVMFLGISFADLGTHNLAIKISNAVPGEYDTGNNDYPFSVNVNSVQPVTYDLSYGLFRSYSSSYTIGSCYGVESYTQQGEFGSWQYTANIPWTPQAPIDSIKWEALSGTGPLSHVLIEGWEPDNSDLYADTYTMFIEDADSSTYTVSLMVYKEYGYSYLDVVKIAGDYFYVYNYAGGTTTYFEQNSNQMDLQDFLEVRLLFADDGLQWGGSGNVEVAPFETTAFSWDNSFDDGVCASIDSGSVSYEYSQNSASGATDPTILPSGNVKSKLPLLASETLPLNTDLVQNYPNPFNPSTNIQFTIEQSGPAVLKVYDMLGKEVAELFQGEATEGRTYNFTFQAANLASGMYYAKLEAGGKQYVKKMLLMK